MLHTAEESNSKVMWPRNVLEVPASLAHDASVGPQPAFQPPTFELLKSAMIKLAESLTSLRPSSSARQRAVLKKKTSSKNKKSVRNVVVEEVAKWVDAPAN